MRHAGILLYGATLLAVALLIGRETIGPTMYWWDELAGWERVMSMVGWLLATAGPLALSSGTWLLERRITHGWALHVVFIPAAILAFRAGEWLFVKATGSPDSDSPLVGFPLLAGMLFLLVALVSHGSAIAARGLRAVHARQTE